ncbi:MAG TPA: F0F1 ATP synthase subunit delta, partial [Dermatophilaceae bacterium]
EALEDDLFRFGRLVAADSELRDALSAHDGDEDAQTALVEALLAGKSSAETIRLVRQATVHARGRRFGKVLEEYLAIAARRKQQRIALVTAAFPLDDAQRQRLEVVLSRIYDGPVQINVVLDLGVVGGIRVQVGDEVVDGTILRRLQDAERSMLR